MRVGLLSLLGFGLVVGVSPGAASALPAWLGAPGALGAPPVTEHFVRHGGRILRYRVHWPTPTDRRAPLVLGLHGRPRNPPVAPFHMLGIGRHDPQGEAIVVAPLVDWDAPWTQTQPMILQALREVARRRAVDPARVAVAGFSMGAPSALYLARNRPRMFSAVMAASGHMPEDVLDDLADRRTRVLLSWSGSPSDCRRTVDLAARIAERGGNSRAVVFPGGGHEAHLDMMSDRSLWRWFVSQPDEAG